MLRNEVIKPGVTAVNITPLDPFFRRKQESLSHSSRKHLAPGLLFVNTLGINRGIIGVFFLLAVASSKDNRFTELLSNFNTNRDPRIKSFISPLVVRKNSNQACFSAVASPIITNDFASTWLVRPKKSGFGRMSAVVPEMIFNITHPIRNRPGKRRLPTTKENPSFSDIASPYFRPYIYHV